GNLCRKIRRRLRPYSRDLRGRLVVGLGAARKPAAAAQAGAGPDAAPPSAAHTGNFGRRKGRALTLLQERSELVVERGLEVRAQAHDCTGDARPDACRDHPVLDRRRAVFVGAETADLTAGCASKA